MKAYLIAGAAVLLVALLVVGDLWARRQGAASCLAADTAAGTKAVVHNTQVEAAGTIAGAAEDAAREKALAGPLAPTPTVGVQPGALTPAACGLPQARPAAGARQPADHVRAADPPSVVQPSWDSFIGSDVQRARAADIEIADRDELLRQRDAVCRGIAPTPPTKDPP